VLSSDALLPDLRVRAFKESVQASGGGWGQGRGGGHPLGQLLPEELVGERPCLGGVRPQLQQLFVQQWSSLILLYCLIHTESNGLTSARKPNDPRTPAASTFRANGTADLMESSITHNINVFMFAISS